MAVLTRVRVDTKSVWGGTLGSRALRWVVVALVVGVVVLDSGSVLMTRMSLTDTGREAGRMAAKAVSGLPMTSQTAVVGFIAAKEVTDYKDGVTLRETGFEVLQGGGVALTVVRTAPSLVLGRIPSLAHFGVVVVPVVVDKPVT
jgi:hypothetical protein